MFNWIVSDTYQYLDLWQIELLEIEQLDHLTVCIYKMCFQIIYI